MFIKGDRSTPSVERSFLEVLMQKPKKYQLKTLFKGGEVKRYFSKKQKRIYHKVKEANESDVKNFYIRVSYGMIIDNAGKTTEAVNEGTYANLTYFLLAWTAFNESI
jgi:hypothetical protein